MKIASRTSKITYAPTKALILLCCFCVFRQQEIYAQQQISAQKETAVNEYLSKRLSPIKQNFAAINSIKKWDSIATRDLEETTEGGEAKYYFQKGKLKKIVTEHFGETFKVITEYYLLNNELSFVFERQYRYNRPIYWDSTAMKEGNDTEVFDPKKSIITEDRSYFERGHLIHQINNEDCGSPFSDEYLQKESKRMEGDLRQLMDLLK